MAKTMKKQAKMMQHLGLVAGVCRELQLAERIDQLVPRKKRKVSVGTAVEATILNAMGFTGRALYLTPNFFRGRPVDQLLGKEGLIPEDLHDDCLGTALEALWEAGITETFYKIASEALRQFGINHRFVHLDSTSFSLHGQYDKEESGEDREVVEITRGFSKDNAPELNQVILSMITSYKSSIPLWIEALSGNESDKKSFRETIKKFSRQMKGQETYYVADSALYTKAALQELSHTKWVTRVPETLKEAKEKIAALQPETMTSCERGFRIQETKSQYAGVNQRWILVYSEQARQREGKTLRKRIDKEMESKSKELWHKGNHPFACQTDAEKAAREFEKGLKYHRLNYQLEKKLTYAKKGRPAAGSTPTGEKWFLRGSLEEDETVIAGKMASKGVFIIATNVMDPQELTAEQLLDVYKSQGTSVERGFRFLKDPLFFAESLYLKSPKRIMALLMVMTLSLMIYSLAERKLRNSLKENKKTVSDQKGKPTDNPTIRWVFQMFENVLLITLGEGQKAENFIMNITPDNETILECLGPPYQKMYFLA